MCQIHSQIHILVQLKRQIHLSDLVKDKCCHLISIPAPHLSLAKHINRNTPVQDCSCCCPIQLWLKRKLIMLAMRVLLLCIVFIGTRTEKNDEPSNNKPTPIRSNPTQSSPLNWRTKQCKHYWFIECVLPRIFLCMLNVNVPQNVLIGALSHQTNVVRSVCSQNWSTSLDFLLSTLMLCVSWATTHICGYTDS